MIIYSDNKDKVSWPTNDSHDPDSEVEYPIYYFVPIRLDSKAYTKDIDIVIPPVFNGCMYECISGGITASTTPTFPTEERGTFEDGDVTWRCVPLTTRLGYGDSISTSTWTGDVDVVLTGEAIVDGIYTKVKVTGVPSEAKEFTITNTISILYASGNTEIRQKSLVIPIKEL